MGNKLKKVILASQIAEWCGIILLGEDIEIEYIVPFGEFKNKALCFSTKSVSQNIPKGILIITTRESFGYAKSVLISDNPRLAYARIVAKLDDLVGFESNFQGREISPSAEISPMAYIAQDVKIGARTKIMPFAFIGNETIIGDDCVVKSGAVIGQDGFGFERDELGIPLRIKHLGKVLIGDSVEIGCGTTICRGTLKDTIIDDYVKIDDHVHIAHNVHVERGAMIIACAEISGGVLIKEKAWIGPNASIIQKLVIGTESIVGIGANVINSVPDFTVVAGNPARKIK